MSTKHFRIKRLSKKLYRIDQRHTFLFFFHWWDHGSSDLSPYYMATSRNNACDLIASIANTKKFNYVIHNN